MKIKLNDLQVFIIGALTLIISIYLIAVIGDMFYSNRTFWDSHYYFIQHLKLSLR